VIRAALACVLLIAATPARQTVAVPQGISFWDASNGLAWTTSGIEATRDGGRTWTALLRARSVTQVAAARGTSDAWLVEGRCDFWPRCRPRLLRSGDRGRTWHPIGKAVLGLSMATAKLGLGSLYDKADRWSLLRTGDGGRSWSRVPSPCGEVGPWGLPHAALTSARTGLVGCGGQPGAGNQLKAVFRTTDAAHTWRLVMSTGWRFGRSTPGAISEGGYLDAIAAAEGRAWAWLDRGRAYTSNDGGRRWSALAFTQPETVVVWGMSAVSRNVAYALVRIGGARTRFDLRMTKDGGRSWRIVHTWP
jgi:photosystem II stability/assembly factor-like uncharacterized protein